MKKYIFFFLIITACPSCISEDEKQPETVTLSPNDIQLNDVIHDSLSAGQLVKVKRVCTVFAEVYPVSFEETVTNFKRDQNPDQEIAVWMDMADAYEKYMASKPALTDLKKKKEIFGLLLLRSMMPEEEALKNQKNEILTEAEAKEVMGYYTAKPKPIDVVEGK